MQRNETEDGAGLDALRIWFRKHNLNVLLLAAVTLAISIASWAAIYFVLYWLALLALTAASGGDAKVSPSFFPTFIISAAVICIVAWLARQRWPDERPRDHKSPIAVAGEILLTVPRTTLAVWDTFSAFQILSESELADAWQLIQRLGKTPVLPVHGVPLELPEPISRERILFALQIAGLIEFQRRANALVLTLRDEQARALSQVKIRIGQRR